MKKYSISQALLDEIIKYIEENEDEWEWEKGECRSLDKIIELGYMPEIYNELIKLKKEI